MVLLHSAVHTLLNALLTAVQALILGFDLICSVAFLSTLLFPNIRQCRNKTAVFFVTFLGLAHLLYCTYVLNTDRALNSPESDDCSSFDIHAMALVANGLTIATITGSYFYNSSQGQNRNIAKPLVVLAIAVGSCATVVFMYAKPLELQQLLNVSKDTREQLLFTVCKRYLPFEIPRLLLEYLFVYIPTFILWCGELVQICINYHKGSNPDILVISPCTESCICDKINRVFLTTIFYYLVFILVIRPLHVLYGFATGGFFHDVIPSLINTSLFSLLCLEVAIAVIQLKRQKTSESLLPVKS